MERFAQLAISWTYGRDTGILIYGFAGISTHPNASDVFSSPRSCGEFGVCGFWDCGNVLFEMDIPNRRQICVTLLFVRRVRIAVDQGFTRLRCLRHQLRDGSDRSRIFITAAKLNLMM